MEMVAIAVTIPRRREFAFGRERYLAHAQGKPPQLPHVDPRLGGQHQEGDIDHIAGGALLAEVGFETGIVAEHGRQTQRADGRASTFRGRVAGERKTARNVEALARHIHDPVAGKPEPFGGQAIEGQGAGLVGGDDGACAKPLHGG